MITYREEKRIHGGTLSFLSYHSVDLRVIGSAKGYI